MAVPKKEKSRIWKLIQEDAEIIKLFWAIESKIIKWGREGEKKSKVYRVYSGKI